MVEEQYVHSRQELIRNMGDLAVELAMAGYLEDVLYALARNMNYRIPRVADEEVEHKIKRLEHIQWIQNPPPPKWKHK